MMASFILCLLPALLATTRAQDALTCNSCTDSKACQTPQNCTGLKAAGGCFTVAEENKLAPDGTKHTGFSRGCVNATNSGLNGVITFTVETDTYLRMNAKQCSNADKCNTDDLQVPQGDTTPNGRQCPTCFSANSGSCNAQPRTCTGAETHCIDFTGTLTTGPSPAGTPFAGKGCATADAAGIKDGTTLVFTDATYKFTKATTTEAQKTTTTKATTTTTTTKATTTKTITKATTATTSGGSPALGKFSFALYLPGLAGLLLVKLLH